MMSYKLIIPTLLVSLLSGCSHGYGYRWGAPPGGGDKATFSRDMLECRAIGDRRPNDYEATVELCMESKGYTILEKRYGWRGD